MTLATASNFRALVCARPVELGGDLCNDPELRPDGGPAHPNRQFWPRLPVDLMSMAAIRPRFSGLRATLLASLAITAACHLARADSAKPPTTQPESKTMSGLDMPKPKRVGAPTVAPLTVGGLRFEVLRKTRSRGFDQNGGVIAAIDAASGKELWTLKVYLIDYFPKLETDVQDIFIVALEKAGDNASLIVKDERHRQFIVDIATRSAKPAP